MPSMLRSNKRATKIARLVMGTPVSISRKVPAKYKEIEQRVAFSNVPVLR